MFLLFGALFICAASLWYTNRLVNQLSEEEKKKVRLWAEGTKRLANMEETGDLSFALEVITSNTTVPVILTDSNDQIKGARNLDSLRMDDSLYLKSQLQIMKSEGTRLEIPYAENQVDYIYYKDSVLLTRLRYYPFVQLGIIGLFLAIAYFAFSSSRKAEQNQVWVGMAKETAHQLGTPLSSLLAWVEVLKSKGVGSEFANEVERDLSRLQTITERFSKIGATPVLTITGLTEVVEKSIDYIRSRTSENVHFMVKAEPGLFSVPLNVALFEWVIENLCKNAVDAMNGNGSIEIRISDQQQFVYLDISDTGKGINKSDLNSVFKPGFTTKSRGWGLGLSLAKRIVEEYHGGEIFVKSSTTGKGTTFRIVLKK